MPGCSGRSRGCTLRRSGQPSPCCAAASIWGETMRTMSLPEYLGTVVVHRGDAVTCTRDSCPRDLSLESWFSHHTSFMTCRADECPHCVFEAPATQLGHGLVKARSSSS